jgi:hypothetical protein
VGLDFIITPESDPDPDGRVVLVELQLGFGRLGLYRLFPRANRLFRKTSWYLRHESGRLPWLTWRLRRICNDKIKTYRVFSDLQPESLAYRGWDEGVERWLAGLEERFVLIKPPRGSCGEGIEVFEREALLRSAGALIPPGLALPLLLQAFVQSRILHDDAGRPHVGCIRHIVIVHSDGQRLGFIHMPAYWRVSPAALAREADGAVEADKEALTANISRGAAAVEVEPREGERVRRLSEEICARLICRVLELDGVERGTSDAISPEGELSGELVERIGWR